jgi:hypothetical protein
VMEQVLSMGGIGNQVEKRDALTEQVKGEK